MSFEVTNIQLALHTNRRGDRRAFDKFQKQQTPQYAGNREEMHSERHTAMRSHISPSTKKGQGGLSPPVFNMGWSFCPAKLSKKKKQMETRLDRKR